MSSTTKKVLVVAGLGKGTGTGASVAHQFAKAGYHVAIVTTRAETIDNIVKDITSAGGEAAGFQVAAYTPVEIAQAWAEIRSKYTAPQYRIEAAVFNATHFLIKAFLDVAPEEFKDTLTVVEAAFTFSKGAIEAFKSNEISEPDGKRGTLITTGSPYSVKAVPKLGVLAVQKSALRALSQSLNKEFGKENIHVAHVLIGGPILTERLANHRPDAVDNPNVRLDPNSIAQSYLYLVNQDRSAWTWELDLRPAHEQW